MNVQDEAAIVAIHRQQAAIINRREPRVVCQRCHGTGWIGYRGQRCFCDNGWRSVMRPTTTENT